MFVPVAPIVPATAKFFWNGSTPICAYLSDEASIEAIVSPIIVIVVFGAPYVDGIDTIATRTVELSVHLIIIPFATYVVTSPVTVNDVLPTRVGVPGIVVQNDEPDDGVAHDGTPEASVKTCPSVPFASLVYALALEAYAISPEACEVKAQLEPSFAATVFEVVGNVIVVPSVPASVIELLFVNVFPFARTIPLEFAKVIPFVASVVVSFAVKVFPSAIVSVALVAGAVIVSLLIDVAVATPRVGVVNTGLVVSATSVPVPETVYSPTTPALL